MLAAGTVDAILMASGSGARFGGAKLLAPFRALPLACHTLNLFTLMNRISDERAPCFRKIFFIAADAAVMALAERYEGITLIQNTRPFLGKRESIRLGAQVSEAEYLLFSPCDQGLLDEVTVRRILDARRPGAICRPEYEGESGAPVLFSGLYRQELAALGAGESGKEVIRRHREALVKVRVPRREPLIDFDTPDILLRYEQF